MTPPPGTFAQLWDQAVAERGEATFLVFESSDGDVRHWSYVEFDQLVGRTAGALAERGVAPRSAVQLVLGNSPLFVATWLAAARLGAFVVPSDPRGAVPELRAHLTRTRPAVLVVDAHRRFEVQEMIDALQGPGGRPAVVAVDEREREPSWFAGVATPPRTTGNGPDSADRAAVMFTSGTTGRPKGVEISQANYVFAAQSMATAAALGPDDRQLVVLPLFHANAQYYSFAPAIGVGASVALMSGFSASRFLEQTARHGATHASLFAGPMRMILARGGPLPPDAKLRLRHCWFAQNLSADQYDELAGWMGCRPRQLYGMTETIAAVLTDCAGEPQPDSMGLVTAGCEVDLQDEAGATCSDGEVGEIVVRGVPGRTLFTGYLDDPDSTAAAFRDGWFLTGDRATRDREGRFRFAGRHSDILKVAGENVSVVEVETVLTAHPHVLEAAVVGAPDDLRDEVCHAYLVPREPDTDHAQLVASLEEWATTRLSKPKRPVRYEVLSELPRTSVGKIRRFELVPSERETQERPG